ncbi:MAG: cation diffusion facilitator family transporter [Candidatus Manganitrophaceae bacterium]
MKRDYLKLVFCLTAVYFFIELAGGLYYNSLALVTDASFMAINLAGQIMAHYAKWLSQKPPDKSMTFGYERAKVLSGLFNGLALGFVLFYVLVDAIKRMAAPEPLDTGNVLNIAIIGLLVNGFGMVALFSRSNDVNMRGPFLLILNDTLGSIGVIASSLIIKWTGLYVIDAVTSVLIGLLIVFPTYHLIKENLNILMEGIPSQIDIEKVEIFLRERFTHITRVDDLHVWALIPEKALLAAKLKMDGAFYDRQDVAKLKQVLKEKFGFHDVYLEIEEN